MKRDPPLRYNLQPLQIVLRWTSPTRGSTLFAGSCFVYKLFYKCRDGKVLGGQPASELLVLCRVRNRCFCCCILQTLWGFMHLWFAEWKIVHHFVDRWNIFCKRCVHRLYASTCVRSFTVFASVCNSIKLNRSRVFSVPFLRSTGIWHKWKRLDIYTRGVFIVTWSKCQPAQTHPVLHMRQLLKYFSPEYCQTNALGTNLQFQWTEHDLWNKFRFQQRHIKTGISQYKNICNQHETLDCCFYTEHPYAPLFSRHHRKHQSPPPTRMTLNIHTDLNSRK